MRKNLHLATRLVPSLALLLAGAHAVHAASEGESRRETLENCVKQAQEKELTGDAHVAFMRGCAKPPAGKAPAQFAQAASGANGIEPPPLPLQPAR